VRQRGFTLVEVLVALMVMAIVAVMAWQGVDGIVRTRAASEERLERTLRLSTVLAQWEQDIASIQDTTTLPAALSFDGASVRITRRAERGVQLVVWSLRPDPANPQAGSVLTRWAAPAITRGDALSEAWMRSQQLQGSTPGQLQALTGLAQWQVYFYVGNAWSNAQSTGNVAAPTPGQPSSAPQRVSLPQGVRLVLTFAPGSGFNGTVTRDVVLSP